MVVSFVVLGAFVGAAGAGSLNNVVGRRGVLMFGSASVGAGSVLMAVATGLNFMLFARVVTGIGVGLTSHTVPLYLSECAPTNLRGMLCFLNTVMVVMGQVAAAVISTALVYGEVNDGWRWMLGLGTIPAVAMFLIFLALPESPRWLLSQGENDEAKTVLRGLRDGTPSEEVEEEFRDMFKGIVTQTPRRFSESHRELTESRWSLSCSEVYNAYWKDKRTRRALLLGCGLQTLQQWVGINTIMYYGASLMMSASPPTDGLYCFSAQNKRDVAFTVLFAGAQQVGLLISLGFVERAGRRPLMLVSLGGVIVSLLAVGFSFTAAHVSQTLVVIFVIVYLVFFGMGVAPVPWTVNAEIYPTHVRAQCISISTSMNWIMNFVVSYTFLSLSRALSTNQAHPRDHPDGVFWLYAAVGVVGFGLLWRWMPETKGLSLEEIERVFTTPDEVKLVN